jgi:glutamine synthetase
MAGDVSLRPEDLVPEGFRTVIVTSADVTGRLVGKRFAPDVFLSLLEEGGVALSSCVLGWDIEQWPGPTQAYTGHHTGWHDVRLIPDLPTLRPAAWLDRTAICMADFAELGDGLVEVAPRTILRRQLERAADTGLEAVVASELEFALYRGTYDEGREDAFGALRPSTLARADYTIQAGDRDEGFFAGVREALSASGLDPWTSQAEWGLGQWEINLRHTAALEMADRHALFKLCLRDLAAASGMAVTFMAKPFDTTTGSSCHLHLSLVDADRRNAFADPDGTRGTSARLLAAVGGVLERAPELMLLYAPTVNSYRRTTSGEFSGNGTSWGWDSRMVSCRVLAGSEDETRLEWRVPGADVNPYLAIAALLSSAHDGIANEADPGEPLEGEAYADPVPPLPATLGEAVDAFRASAFAKDVFGEAVVAHYAEAGRWEWERFLAPDVVTEWERRRYFEHI